MRCGRRRFGKLSSGYARCSRKNVLRRMRACFLKVCSGTSNARQVGCARRRPAIPAHGGNRRSWVAGIGTPMRCAISCVTMSSSIWRMTTQCWWSTRPAFSSKAKRRAEWRGNTRVRQARLRTARSASSLPTFRAMVMRSSIARCIFRRTGPTIRIVWKLHTCLPMSALRPNQNLRRE